MKFLWFSICIIWRIQQCYPAGIMDNVVFAVNCGGEAHTDANGKRERMRDE
jgi:hypothetical protein